MYSRGQKFTNIGKNMLKLFKCAVFVKFDRLIFFNALGEDVEIS